MDMSENQDSNTKASYVLSNVAEVVEIIMTFVPTKSLFRIASVCRLWRNTARRVLKNQERMAWISACGASTQVHCLCDNLAEEVEKVFLLPKTVLAMVDSKSFDANYCHREKRRSRCLNVDDELNMVFPKDCDILGITTDGIVLTPTGSRTNLPQEYRKGEAGFALMFPSIEGVHIKPFHFCEKTFSQVALKEAGLVDNPELRVVLLFASLMVGSEAFRLLNKVLEALAKSKALITGGFMEKVFSPPRTCCSQKAYSVVGLALSGPKVQGASVLLDEDIDNAEAAEAMIQRLKAAKIPEKNTLGFMFGDYHRNFFYHEVLELALDDEHESDVDIEEELNVEADAFHKVFPNTPLLGFFSDIEISFDPIKDDDTGVTDIDDMKIERTTVMTLVHLG